MMVVAIAVMILTGGITLYSLFKIVTLIAKRIQTNQRRSMDPPQLSSDEEDSRERVIAIRNSGDDDADQRPERVLDDVNNDAEPPANAGMLMN